MSYNARYIKLKDVLLCSPIKVESIPGDTGIYLEATLDFDDLIIILTENKHFKNWLLKYYLKKGVKK